MRSRVPVTVSMVAAAFLSAMLLAPALRAEPATEVASPAADGESVAADLSGCLLEFPPAAGELRSAEEVGFCPAVPEDDGTDPFVADTELLGGTDGLIAAPTAKPPRPLGFCRCGCGIRCQTSADCGGGSCDRFITCC